MKVQLLTANQMHRYGAADVDDVVEVPDAIAADLIAQGIAREPGEKKAKGGKPENQTGPGGSSEGGKAGVKKPKG